MNLEHATPELFTALVAAQSEMENATKNATNPHLKNKYADLSSILAQTRPVLAAHGLALIQSTGYDGNLVTVTTAICHTGGGYVSSVAACAPAKVDPQGVGSATTYLRRYSLAAMCGITQEDDDGEDASKRKGRGDGEPIGGRYPAERKTLEACASMGALQAAWKALRPEVREALVDVKESCKSRIEQADSELAA